MNRVMVRVYGALNDFLPPARRHVPHTLVFEGRTSVKDLIERAGVPHPEVDLILVNGESVGFDRLVRDADRVAVFPRFRTLDIGSVTRVRPPPLDAIRFVLDGHLGKLARYLRLVGLDATCPAGARDAELADTSAHERRILLTRDQPLLKRKVVAYGYFVRQTTPQQQLVEVLRHFGPLPLAPFTRCLLCNTTLRDVPKSAVDARLPGRTRQAFDEFRTCGGCGRVYWRGSHWGRLSAIVEAAANLTVRART